MFDSLGLFLAVMPQCKHNVPEFIAFYAHKQTFYDAAGLLWCLTNAKKTTQIASVLGKVSVSVLAAAALHDAWTQ